VSEHWLSNPFHRMRLVEATPDRVENLGNYPRVGDSERGRELGR
jgi:hypothetical protein